MRRWHQEHNLMYRRWRMELGNHTGSFIGPEERANHCWLAPPHLAKGIDCHCARGIGTMRKNRPYAGGAWNRWEKHFEHKRRVHRERAAIQFELDA